MTYLKDDKTLVTRSSNSCDDIDISIIKIHHKNNYCVKPGVDSLGEKISYLI